MDKETVSKAINEIRPALQNDGGDIEFISLDGNIVHVRLVGACAGCPMSQITLSNGVQRYLRETLGNKEIVVVNDDQIQQMF